MDYYSQQSVDREAGPAEMRAKGAQIGEARAMGYYSQRDRAQNNDLGLNSYAGSARQAGLSIPKRVEPNLGDIVERFGKIADRAHSLAFEVERILDHLAARNEDESCDASENPEPCGLLRKLDDHGDRADAGQDRLTAAIRKLAAVVGAPAETF